MFYHFTSRFHLSHMLKEGIYRGDVPLSPELGTQGVWLTTDGRPQRQKWCSRNSYFIIAGQKHVLDKTEYRLTIEVDESEPTLFRWDKLASTLNIDPRYYEFLNISGGGGGEAWYVYFGTISPDHIVTIEHNSNGNGKWLVVTDTSTLAEYRIMFNSAAELMGMKITRIPQEEILNQVRGTRLQVRGNIETVRSET